MHLPLDTKFARSLTFLATSVALAFPIPAVVNAAPESAAPPPAAPACPKTLALESTNGTDYVAVFNAPSQVSATFSVTLYSKDKVYTVTTPTLTLATPYQNESSVSSYRSAAIDLQNAAKDELIAASIVPSIPNATTSCPQEDIFVPSLKSLTDPHRVVSKEQAALENSFGSEIGMGEHALAMAGGTPMTFACKAPFVRAGLTQESMPQYTQDATLQHASGIVNIFVDLNPAGGVARATIGSFSGNHDLDVSALTAAQASTYHPEVFACRPRASHYLFSVDFQNGGSSNIANQMPSQQLRPGQ